MRLDDLSGFCYHSPRKTIAFRPNRCWYIALPLAIYATSDVPYLFCCADYRSLSLCIAGLA